MGNAGLQHLMMAKLGGVKCGIDMAVDGEP
jgi:hypothetical protein